MRIVRRSFQGGKLDGKQLLVRSDIATYKYIGEEYELIGEVFRIIEE